MAEEGAKVKSLEESFMLMAKNSGVAIGDLMSKMKDATKVDDSNLIRMATRLMAEGFSAQQIANSGSRKGRGAPDGHGCQCGLRTGRRFHHQP